MKKDSYDIMDQIHSIMWHMRGSISRDEAWTMSYEERRNLLKHIEDRVKAVEKSGLPIL